MMQIKEFCMKYKNCREGQEKERFIEKHILKDKYVSYPEKIENCKAIVNVSCYKKIKIGESEKTIFKLDSPARYFSYCIAMIRNYTDLVFDNDKTVEGFDMLAKFGLIDALFHYMPENEVATMQTILNMILDDLMENERSLVSMMEGASEGVVDMLAAFSNATKELIEDAGNGK